MMKRILEGKARGIVRHFPEAVLLGALLGLISTTVINYGLGGVVIVVTLTMLTPPHPKRN